MKIFPNIKDFLNSLLLILGVKKDEAPYSSGVTPEEDVREPASNRVNAPALFLKSGIDLALVIDHRFHDVPCWVEWSMSDQTLCVVMMGGDVDLLKAKVARTEKDFFKAKNRVLLVSNDHKGKIMHHISLIVRDHEAAQPASQATEK